MELINSIATGFTRILKKKQHNTTEDNDAMDTFPAYFFCYDAAVDRWRDETIKPPNCSADHSRKESYFSSSPVAKAEQHVGLDVCPLLHIYIPDFRLVLLLLLFFLLDCPH